MGLVHWIVDMLFTGSRDPADPWYKRVPPMGWVLTVVVLGLFIYGFCFDRGTFQDTDSGTMRERRLSATSDVPQESPEASQEPSEADDHVRGPVGRSEPSDGATEAATP